MRTLSWPAGRSLAIGPIEHVWDGLSRTNRRRDGIKHAASYTPCSQLMPHDRQTHEKVFRLHLAVVEFLMLRLFHQLIKLCWRR